MSSSTVTGQARDPLTRRLGKPALALLFGLFGGGLFAYLQLPLPWMLGALSATMAASLAGAPVSLPPRLRQSMIAVVGLLLGSAFTPERFAHIPEWLPSLLTLPVYVIVIGVLILFYLRRFSDFDSRTAFFAATPGGLSEMIALADRMGGDLRNVSLVHAARLLLIVFTIPFLASVVAGVDSGARPVAGGEEVDPLQLLLLALIGALGWALGAKLRLPAASFMGPLFLSILVHAMGWIDHRPPQVLLAAAQLVIGAAVGVRFSGVPIRLILRTLLLGAGGTLLMFVFTFLFAEGLHQGTGLPLPLLLVALIPGGFPEMSLIALAMGFDPAFVVTHHCFRVLMVVVLALPIFTLLQRRGWFERHWPGATPTEDAKGPAE
jgi:membrane AbrB-like protein